MGQHYYSKEPVSASNMRHIEYEIRWNGQREHFRFDTDSGVFSITRVDHGTDILLNAIAKDAASSMAAKGAEDTALPQRILDIGCGYGPIGITLGRFFPQAHIHMIDVNERAMDLARRNAQAAGLKDFTVESAENFSAESPDSEKASFQMIVTNPPIRAGKAVVYGIFAQAQELLMPCGALYVVIRKNQGGPSAIKELTRLFGSCEVIEREAGFHILKCIK